MATLKISDLSVGDWVQDKNGIYAKVIGVENWSNGYFLNIELHGVNVGSTPLASAHPIPITEEILGENGFVKKNYDNGKMWDWCCDNILVRKLADEDFYRFVVAFNSEHYTTMMVVVKHTHQLQHALRLAVVDKDINL